MTDLHRKHISRATEDQTASEPEFAGHGAPAGTVRLGAEKIPVDLATADVGFEAPGKSGAFRVALERLVSDAAYRDAVLAEPSLLSRDDAPLHPGEVGLLLAVCWAAYGPDVAGHLYSW